jgi:four helix bundle protein
VFQRAYRRSLEIHRASLELPRIEQGALADQIRRASKSICANLAEGFGRQAVSKPEFRRFVTMALGSAGEMQVWTLYCRDLGHVDSDAVSTAMWPSVGGAHTGRLPGCAPLSIAAVLISDL